MASFAFVDLQIPGKRANRDHTGGFGSFMKAEGLMGTLVSKLKGQLIRLPVLHFGSSAAILRQAGHTVNFYQGPTSGEDYIIIASSMHCYLDELAFARSEKLKHQRSKIGFFGPFVKVYPEKFLPDADFIITDEIETTLFAYLNVEHDFEGTLSHGLVKDMDTLPMSDWHGMDISQYNYFPLLHQRPFMSMQTSRGCSFNCDFCPYMVSQTKKFRARSPKLVVDEIEFLVNTYGIKSILFRDICFTLNKKHAQSIAEEIIARGIKIEWACETRVDCMTTELVDIMYQSGFRGVNFGIETGNVDTLKDSGKRSPEIEFQNNLIAYLHQKGVRINAFYMLGLIGDTKETMRETIRYAEYLNTLGAQYCTMTPFPGTNLFERLENKLTTRDFTNFSEYQPVVNIDTASAEEITAAAKRAYQYYFRLGWWSHYGVRTSVRLISTIFSGFLLSLGKPNGKTTSSDHRGFWVRCKESYFTSK